MYATVDSNLPAVHISDHPYPVYCSRVSVQMKGEAEAFAVEAKGRAEAEQMSKKAEAFSQYKEGAMVEMLLENLPLVRLTHTI